MAKEQSSNGNGIRIWILRVSAAIVVCAAVALAAAVQRNRERIIEVEGHIPYIRQALDRIERRLGELALKER